MQLLSRFLRIFFHLLYHSFAWTYDLVSWTVSLGRWKDWGKSVVPSIEGTRVLELGHGPGYLQRLLRDLNFFTVGLDESRQMGYHTKRRLLHNGYTQVNLVRGLAQFLPFPTGSFDTVVSTFPSAYIFEQATLLEVRRTLTDGGRLIVLPVAWITGKSALERLMSWLFRFTGQTPSAPLELVKQKLSQPFESAGFQVETRQVEVKSSLVLILIGSK